MKKTFAMHYPSAYAPPVGVWWWDDTYGGVRNHYLAGHAEISQALAKDLAGVATVSEWNSRLEQLRERAPSSEDKMRTTSSTVWSPLDVLLTTISHWPLRW